MIRYVSVPSVIENYKLWKSLSKGGGASAPVIVLSKFQEVARMQRFITASLVILLLGLAVLWAGCSRRSPTVAPIQSIQPTVEAETVTPPEEAVEVAIPDWFIEPPVDSNYLYATATFKARDLQFAINNAKTAARLDIAGQIGTRVQGLFKRFREEVGTEEDSELLAMTTAVSKEVVSEVLQGARTAKQDVKKESISYIAYVLMEMPIGEANNALMKRIKANKNIYTQFRASQGFRELEAEVEKYEQRKKEQEQGQ